MLNVVGISGHRIIRWPYKEGDTASIKDAFGGTWAVVDDWKVKNRYQKNVALVIKLPEKRTSLSQETLLFEKYLDATGALLGQPLIY